MLTIPFESLLLKKQTRFASSTEPVINARGYDTETIGGLCALLCDSEGNTHHPLNIYTILEFLTAKKNRGTIGFFFNLKYDFQAVLKYLPPEDWTTIYHTGELKVIDDEKEKPQEYSLKYIPKKMLLIKKAEGINKKTGETKYRQFKYYDIAQYYRTTLDKAAKEYLGEGKQEHDFDLANLTLEDMHHPLMIKYCIRDANLTRRLAEHWIGICQSQDLHTSNFCSPASISGRYFASKVDMPDASKMMESKTGRNLLRYGWNTCSGAFISCFKRGAFEQAHEYDICSAYPDKMSKLPDFRGGKFFYSKRFRTDATHGWLKCRVIIDYDTKESYHPAMPVLRENACNYYPVGEFEQFLTLDEFYRYEQVFDVEFLDGVFWIPDDELTYPFYEIINDLYNRRNQTDDANVNFFIKIILNGIYGKFLEKHKIINPEDSDYGKYSTGNFFNPFVASYILAGARLQVFDLLATIPNKNILACFTDSVLTTEKLPIGKVKKLGEWGYEQSGSAVIIGCGVYSIDAGNKIKTRIRGFNTGGRVDLFSEMAKTPDEKLNALPEKLRNKVVSQGKNLSESMFIKIKTNIAPLSSVIQKKPDTMNFLLDEIKSININFDTKRLWHGNFKNSRELLERNIDSEPVLHL